MLPGFESRMALAGAFFSMLAGVAAASPQVVGDEACGYYDVDMAAFASCVDGKVVVPESADSAHSVAMTQSRDVGWSAFTPWLPIGGGLAPYALPLHWEPSPIARMYCAQQPTNAPHVTAPYVFAATRFYSQ